MPFVPLLLTTAALAGTTTSLRCIEDSDPLGDVAIGLGCDTPACCVKCDDNIEATIELTGDGPVDLELLDGPANPSKEVAVSGKGYWVDTHVLRVEPGTTKLKGLRDDGKSTPMLVALPRKGSAAGETTLDIRVSRDGRDINQRRSLIVDLDCLEPTAFGDQVKLTDNDRADRSAVLIDGRSEGGSCVDDRITSTRDVTDPMLNLVEPGTCHTEVAVMSRGDGMALVSDPGFTEGVDTVEVALIDDRRTVPVTMWLAYEDSADRMRIDAIVATLLFDLNRTGINFDFEFVDATDDPDMQRIDDYVMANDSWGAPHCTETVRDDLVASGLYHFGRINVYYSGWDYRQGVDCVLDPGLMVVASYAAMTTLTHELGHAFTLHHLVSADGVGDENLMSLGNPKDARHRFTVAQVLQMNTDRQSLTSLTGGELNDRDCMCEGFSDFECPDDPGCPPHGVDAP